MIKASQKIIIILAIILHLLFLAYLYTLLPALSNISIYDFTGGIYKQSMLIRNKEDDLSAEIILKYKDAIYGYVDVFLNGENNRYKIPSSDYVWLYDYLDKYTQNSEHKKEYMKYLNENNHYPKDGNGDYIKYRDINMTCFLLDSNLDLFSYKIPGQYINFGGAYRPIGGFVFFTHATFYPDYINLYTKIDNKLYRLDDAYNSGLIDSGKLRIMYDTWCEKSKFFSESYTGYDYTAETLLKPHKDEVTEISAEYLYQKNNIKVNTSFSEYNKINEIIDNYISPAEWKTVGYNDFPYFKKDNNDTEYFTIEIKQVNNSYIPETGDYLTWRYIFYTENNKFHCISWDYTGEYTQIITEDLYRQVENYVKVALRAS